MKIKNGEVRRWKEITTPRNGKYISPYSTVRSGYIIQAIRDENADIATSILLEKRNARGSLRIKGEGRGGAKKREEWNDGKRCKRGWACPVRISDPLFPFFLPRIPCAYLIIGVARSFRPLVRSIRSPLLSFQTVRQRFTRQLDLGKLSKTESR